MSEISENNKIIIIISIPQVMILRDQIMLKLCRILFILFIFIYLFFACKFGSISLEDIWKSHLLLDTCLKQWSFVVLIILELFLLIYHSFASTFADISKCICEGKFSDLIFIAVFMRDYLFNAITVIFILLY